MDIIQKEQGDIVTLSVSGRLDALTAVEAEKDFNAVLDAGCDKLLIGLGGLEYISSAGLRVLLVVAKRMQQKGGKVTLSCMVPNVKEVFEISGFSSIFKIFDEETDAVAYLSE